MSPEKSPQSNSLKIILIIIVLLLASLVLYLFFDASQKASAISSLEIEKKQLQLELAQTKERLENDIRQADMTINDLSEKLLLNKERLENIEDDLRRERNINDDFENQIRSLSGTVRDLDKLSRTDRELLQKYSRTYFLNENFVPLKLSQISNKYIMPGKKDQYFHGDAISFLERLLDDASRAGHNIKIISAYRSFDEQQELKGQFTQVYGGGANAFSADQGYSEHQLGTAVDIVDTNTQTTSPTFASTDAYKWLKNNAHRYGFILSYPEGNQFYVFEPWHWRFVGVDLARDLDRSGDSFYDWEQRRIDEYLIKIFD